MTNSPSDSRGPPEYLSFLLRLWQVDGDDKQAGTGATIWRASIENPLTGERRGFASLDALFDFLRQQTGALAVVKRAEEEGYA